jgi:hypothetical protein
MTPYRGKHRRTSADEETQLSQAAEPATLTAPEDANAEEAATPPNAPANR